MKIFRCKNCKHSVTFMTPICRWCGTARPASRRWHAPLVMVMLLPAAYALLSIVFG